MPGDLKALTYSPGQAGSLSRQASSKPSSFIMSSRPRTEGPEVAFRWFTPKKATQKKLEAGQSGARSFDVVTAPLMPTEKVQTREVVGFSGERSPRSGKGSAADEDSSDSDFGSGEVPAHKFGSTSMVALVCVTLALCALGVATFTGYFHPELRAAVPESRGRDAASTVTSAAPTIAGTAFLQAMPTPAPLAMLIASTPSPQEPETFQGGTARSLTSRYMRFRMANDVDGLEALLAQDAALHVDLSQAGMLVSMRINQALGFKKDLSGPTAIAGYYRALPTESGDVPPDPKAFECSGSKCTVTCKVARPVVGHVQDVGELVWDVSTGRLQKVTLTFSVV